MDSAESTSWSLLDKFSSEIFSFGFDPEILSCFWGLFRPSELPPGAPRLLPAAPFYIAVYSKITSDRFVPSTLQCTFTASGVILGVAVSSYGMYTILRSAREKLKQPVSSAGVQSSSSAEHPNNPVDGLVPCLGPGQPSSNEFFQMSKDSYFLLQVPMRPTSLNVGIRSTSSSDNGSRIWDSDGFQAPKDHCVYLEFDDGEVEDIADMRAEYFGPATSDMDSFDDSGGSSNFQTPCA